MSIRFDFFYHQLLFSIATVLLIGWSSIARGQTGGVCDMEMARLTSVQGEVELRHDGARSWQAASLDDRLCIGTTIRTQAFSRAAMAFTNDSTLRLDQLTTLTISGVREARQTWLEMLTGAIHFFSHRPRSLHIRTPFVNAAAEGTEFLIRLGFDEGQIVVYEGALLAKNDYGELRRSAGDAALLRRARAPIPLVVARPRDAVAWTVHYPIVLSDLATGPAPGAYPAPLHIAINRARAGDYEGALLTLDLARPHQKDARLETFRAGILLAVGRMGDAEAAIGRALALDRNYADAYAQRTILHVVQNDRTRAIRDADLAVRLDPDSSTALIAQSYARQARFDLQGARTSLRIAVDKDPDNALAFARLAEIELSFADYGRANEAADRAVDLAPDLARTQIVQGFSRLTEIDTDAARTAFTRAIELESTDPLAHLGLGLAKIRDGRLEAGRRDLEIAASLDPNNALIRSYLGKAYFEEKRRPKDATQFAMAKQLDPNDPTPYLYDAIRKQSENRPIEALQDLYTSIALNDYRAVYRSRLLIDEDLAVRSSRLGRIYADLGFEQLALVEGWKSVAADPTNYSGHRLLADNYRVIPRHEIARDSELLVSQLLQPINLNPVQPQLAGDQFAIAGGAGGGPTSIAYAEYAPLFTSNSAHIQAESLIGSDKTRALNVIGSALHNKNAISAGYFDLETSGNRENNDLSREIHNLFWQNRLSPSTSLQVEFRDLDSDEGDRFDRFFDELFASDIRQLLDERSLRLGLTHRLDNDSVMIGSYVRNKSNVGFTGPILRGDTETEGDFSELRYFQKFGRSNITLGLGYWNADQQTDLVLSGTPLLQSDGKDIHENGYLYASHKLTETFDLTTGLSLDSFENTLVDRTKLNPKLGFSWRLAPKLSLRAAAFQTFQRSVASSQTIEPTNIAGFNQFFADGPATESRRFGIGLDKEFDLGRFRHDGYLFGGVEFSRRDLRTPAIDNSTGENIDIKQNELSGRAYLYWTINNKLSLNFEYQYEDIDFSDETLLSFPSARFDIHRVPLELRLIDRSGVFAKTRATYFYQEGTFENEDRVFVKDRDQSIIIDGAFGYRFPQRTGLASFEVRNLFGTDFQLQEIDSSRPRLSRDRQFLLRLSITL